MSTTLDPNSPAPPRCGDNVLHRPTGEQWLVAWVDPATNDLAWAGWPSGLGRLSDCEVVYRCTDEEHREAVAQWERSRTSSINRSRVLALYGHVLPQPEPTPEEAALAEDRAEWDQQARW